MPLRIAASTVACLLFQNLFISMVACLLFQHLFIFSNIAIGQASDFKVDARLMAQCRTTTRCDATGPG